MGEKKGYIAYVDTGGTFSDAVIVSPDGTFSTGKAATEPNRLERSFIGCLESAGKAMGKSLQDVLSNADEVGYGTTVGTNMIVSESEGPKLGLITTKGFEDRIHQWRLRPAGLLKPEAMHMISSGHPKPLIPRPLIKGVSERVDVAGNAVIPLDETGLRRAVTELIKAGVEGIAICFLWSFLDNAHEVRAREIINEINPGLMVSISSEVAPTMREYPRLMSTIIDLHIGRALKELLKTIERRLQEYGYTRPLLVMQAIGGVAQAEVVHPGTTLHSGPVGGLAGVEFLKRQYGIKNAVGSDVGGTSFDVTIASEKAEDFLREPIVGRYEIATPMREIITIGAGCGTIAWVGEIIKVLHAGPQSAGSEPGPVCYDAGGVLPTVADADLVTNRLNADYFLGGSKKLNRDKAMKAIQEKIADPLGIDVMDAAEGIIKIIDASMQSTLRTTLASKGIDPAKYALFAFGGGGPCHCAGYSAGLGFPKVIIPYFASVFSAFGASTANIRHRYETSPYVSLPKLPFDEVKMRFATDELQSLDQIPPFIIERFNSMIEGLEERIYSELKFEGYTRDAVAVRYEILSRYGGQTWETRVPCPVSRIRSVEDLRTIIRLFEEEYEKVYGKVAMAPRGGLEIITVAVEAEAPTIKPVVARSELAGEDPSVARKGNRQVYFDGHWADTIIYEMDQIKAGNVIQGPAIVEGKDTTLVIPVGRKVIRDEYLNFVMEEI